MPRFFYLTVRNALVFYFFVSVINGISIANATVLSTVLVGLVFGALMAAVPHLLKFFKMQVNMPSSLLLSLVLSFLFFFLMYSGVGGLGNITASSVNLGIGEAVMRLSALETLLVATVVTALSVVGLDALSRRK